MSRMRIRRALTGLTSATALLAAALTSPVLLPTTGAVAASAAATTLSPGVSAYFEMDEPPGATVMRDSGPGHLDSPVDPSGVTSGSTFDGATGYSWPRRAPEAYPPSPERIIQVPDSPQVEPGSGPFTIELRYRTGESYGNITQKGQSATPGGQWKIQAPGGVPSCLFKGSAGQVAASAGVALDDEQWHDLTCAFTSTGVTVYVDGVYRARKLGTAGTIDNTFPMTIGGKIDCDQVDVTCDYFSGDIDFVKITRAANLPPTSSWASSCFGTSCSFDSSDSSDADGSLTRYLWDFGDGQTSTSANPSHAYAAPGSYAVRLTVTDNQATTHRSTRTLTVEDAGPIESPVALVDSAVTVANTSSPQVSVPATATPGDRLLMVLSHNNLSRTVGAPTGVGGWTRLQDLAAGTMGSVAWTKVVQPGEPGTRVTVPLSGSAKLTLTLAAYTGTVATTSVPFASSTFVASATTRRTPVVAASLGDWVVSYWADKSSTTTGWVPDGAVTTRRAACGADGGRICSLLADSGAPLAPAPYGDVAASTDAPSDQATMWSFVLRPGDGGPPPNEAPVAAFTPACDELSCVFDSSASSDPDGQVTSWAWSFGDGATSTDPSATHTYDQPGTYDVTLTVTDDDGATGVRTRTVVVEGPPAASPISLAGSVVAQASNSSPKITVPSGTVTAGDRLLLVLSVNSSTGSVATPTGITGWTLLDDVTASDLRTLVWTKVAAPGDAGTRVTVPLGASAKHTLTVAAYRGVAAAPLTFAGTADTVNHAQRLAPSVSVPAGAWVVSYFADKSSTTTAWSSTAATIRGQACNADSGRVCSAVADSGGPVPAGVRTGASAATDAASSKATAWSIVLAPAG